MSAAASRTASEQRDLPAPSLYANKDGYGRDPYALLFKHEFNREDRPKATKGFVGMIRLMHWYSTDPIPEGHVRKHRECRVDARELCGINFTRPQDQSDPYGNWLSAGVYLDEAGSQKYLVRE